MVFVCFSVRHLVKGLPSMCAADAVQCTCMYTYSSCVCVVCCYICGEGRWLSPGDWNEANVNHCSLAMCFLCAACMCGVCVCVCVCVRKQFPNSSYVCIISLSADQARERFKSRVNEVAYIKADSKVCVPEITA